MKEGDVMFQSAIGRLSDGTWCWSATGFRIDVFCSNYEPEWLPLDDDGCINVGPFKTMSRACGGWGQGPGGIARRSETT
jgi:hypothetical protein